MQSVLADAVHRLNITETISVAVGYYVRPAKSNFEEPEWTTHDRWICRQYSDEFVTVDCGIAVFGQLGLQQLELIKSVLSEVESLLRVPHGMDSLRWLAEEYLRGDGLTGEILAAHAGGGIIREFAKSAFDHIFAFLQKKLLKVKWTPVAMFSGCTFQAFYQFCWDQGLTDGCTVGEMREVFAAWSKGKGAETTGTGRNQQPKYPTPKSPRSARNNYQKALRKSQSPRAHAVRTSEES